MFSALFITLVSLQFSTTLTAVPNLSRKCQLSDSTCLKSVAQEAVPIFASGMPELGIEPLDVMYIAKKHVDVAGLKLTINDAYIKGLKNAVIDKISFDMTNHMFTIKYETDMYIKSKYKASGQLLVMPISGDGDMTIDLKKIQLEMMMPFQIVKNADGKDVLELKSHQFSYDVKGGAHFDLTNLFNGNKILSNTLLSFMNDSWKVLSVEFGRPMLEKVQKKVFEAMKNYLRSQPLHDLAEIL